MTQPAAPDPRKCDTPGCEHPKCPPDWHPEGLDQTHSALRAWIFECACGWKRIEPVKTAISSFVVEKQVPDAAAA